MHAGIEFYKLEHTYTKDYITFEISLRVPHANILAELLSLYS